MSPRLTMSMLALLGTITLCPCQQGQQGQQKKTGPKDEPLKPVVKASKPKREATRLIRFLELPNRRQESIQGLLDLGPRALPALRQALTHPRLEIVTIVAGILRALGDAAAPSLPDLERMASGKDSARSQIASWALARMRPTRQFILIPSKNQKKVLRLALDTGKVLPGPIPVKPNTFDTELLPNGNYLVTSYTQKLVAEYGAKGKRVWAYEGSTQPMDADRLISGDLLISDTGKGQVLQITREGKSVWTYKIKSPYNAERLPNGNTLIAAYGANNVLEVDPMGKKVWSFTCRSVIDAHRLPNGNTLVVSFSGSVREITAEHKVRWELSVPQAYAARLLPGGDVIVASGKGVFRYRQTGKQVWNNLLGTVGSLEIY